MNSRLKMRRLKGSGILPYVLFVGLVIIYYLFNDSDIIVLAVTYTCCQSGGPLEDCSTTECLLIAGSSCEVCKAYQDNENCPGAKCSLAPDDSACTDVEIPFCNKAGYSYFADKCTGSDGGAADRGDYICRASGTFRSDDGCTAASDCDGIYVYGSGKCALGSPPAGFCTTSCSFQDPDSSETSCNCFACGTANESAPSSCSPSLWNIGGEVSATTCCGDDSGEYRIVSSLANTSNFESFSPPSDSEACCNADNKCPYDDTCYENWTRYPDTDGFCNDTKWQEIDDAKEFCDAAIGTNNWNLGPSSSETPHGYNACCGDDANEYNLSCIDNTNNGDCGSDTLACCNSADKCVDHNGNCKSPGACYVFGSAGLKSYCNAGTWEDPDSSESYCTATGCDFEWFSNSSKFGPGTSPSCCGDDLNEFKRWRQCSTTSICTTSIYDYACCNSSSSCVYDSICYLNGTTEDVNGDGIDEYCDEGTWGSTILYIKNLTTNYIYTVTGEKIVIHYFVYYKDYDINATWIDVSGALTLSNSSTCSFYGTLQDYNISECTNSFTASNTGEYNVEVKVNNTLGHLVVQSTKVYTCEYLKRIRIVKRPGVIDPWKLLVFVNKTHITCVKQTLGLTGYGFIFEIRDLTGRLVYVMDVDGNLVPCKFPRGESIPPNVEVATFKRYASYNGKVVVVYLYLWRS